MIDVVDSSASFRHLRLLSNLLSVLAIFPLQSSIFLMVFCAASSGLPGTGLRLIPSLLAASSIHPSFIQHIESHRQHHIYGIATKGKGRLDWIALAQIFGQFLCWLTGHLTRIGWMEVGIPPTNGEPVGRPSTQSQFSPSPILHPCVSCVQSAVANPKLNYVDHPGRPLTRNRPFFFIFYTFILHFHHFLLQNQQF